MATATWLDVDGDWDNTSNWSGGGGAGGVPANSDTVVIGSGTQDITTNVDTGLTGISLLIGPGYSGSIATSGNPLEIKCTLFDFSSSGAACYITGIATGEQFTTVNVQDSVAGENALVFVAGTTSDIGTLNVLGGSGTVSVEANAVLDTLVVTGAASVVTVAANVTSIDTVKVSGGDVTVDENIAVLAECRGGLLTIGDGATVAELRIKDDGVVRYNSSGKCSVLNLWRGFFDGRDNPSASVTKPDTMTVYEGGTADLRNGLLTFSGWAWTANGGLVYPPVGTTVTLS